MCKTNGFNTMDINRYVTISEYLLLFFFGSVLYSNVLRYTNYSYNKIYAEFPLHCPTFFVYDFIRFFNKVILRVITMKKKTTKNCVLFFDMNANHSINGHMYKYISRAYDIPVLANQRSNSHALYLHMIQWTVQTSDLM